MQLKTTDAIALLIKDHEDVKSMFEKFENLTDRSVVGKKNIAEQICQALKIHTKIEEEIFYPAVRRSIDDEALMDEAIAEHDNAKTLITEIESMNPGDDLYDAKVHTLSEQIQHHVEEEEGKMFPKARKSELDLALLAEKLGVRKKELLSKDL